MMQIVCVRSNAGNDVRCDICGQGFVVHWARVAATRRREAKLRVIQELRRQHRDEHSGHHAHEQARFTVTAVVENEAAHQAVPAFASAEA